MRVQVGGAGCWYTAAACGGGWGLAPSPSSIDSSTIRSSSIVRTSRTTCCSSNTTMGGSSNVSPEAPADSHSQDEHQQAHAVDPCEVLAQEHHSGGDCTAGQGAWGVIAGG